MQAKWQRYYSIVLTKRLSVVVPGTCFVKGSIMVSSTRHRAFGLAFGLALLWELPVSQVLQACHVNDDAALCVARVAFEAIHSLLYAAAAWIHVVDLRASRCCPGATVTAATTATTVTTTTTAASPLHRLHLYFCGVILFPRGCGSTTQCVEFEREEPRQPSRLIARGAYAHVVLDSSQQGADPVVPRTKPAC